MKIKLADAFDLQMGKTPARANDEYWDNGTNCWVSISDLSSCGKYIESTKEAITDLAVIESGIKPVPENTVIMSFKLSLGKTAITKEKIYTNEAIMAFIPNGKYEILPNYIYHLFSGKDWTQGTNRAVMGATLNKATLSEVELEVPNICEQQKAVNIFDKMDELISCRKEQLVKLDELVKARFVEMFGDMRNNGKGAIVNTSSICGLVGDGELSSYHATKGAILQMTKQDAIQYAPEHIRVNCVCPGSIMTPLMHDRLKVDPQYFEKDLQRYPLGYFGEPEDVAYGVLFLASDEGRFVTGAALPIDGGYTAQ